MSYCRELGKDKLIFLTRKDYDENPPKIRLPEYEGEPGLILKNGDINWGCPCLGNMATGPCGFAFRDAFSCVRNSKEEPKGSECFEKFKAMQDCFDKHPALYGSLDDDNMKDLDKDDSSKGVNAESKT